MPNPATTKKDYRKKRLAKIHILKDQLGLDIVTYRKLLFNLTGKNSSADMNAKEHWIVINYMAGDTKIMPVTVKQRQKVWRLCQELSFNDSNLRTFCNRQIGKNRPETLEEGTKVITGLLAVIRDRKTESLAIDNYKEV